jgi:ParB family chromosome partitioning protein
MLGVSQGRCKHSRMGLTRKKMTDHKPKDERPSDVDWGKVAPRMVHVDHSESGVARLSVAVAPPGGHAGPSDLPPSTSLGLSTTEQQERPESSQVVPMVHVDHTPPSAEPEFRHLRLSSISPNPRQPRSHFDEEDLRELADSVMESGVLQPVVVRPGGGERWELIMGERRWRAAGIAGLETIPAVIREVPDDQLLKEAIIENIQRAALNPVEEALALQALLDDWGVGQEEVGKAIGKSRISVSHALAILRLPDEVQRRVASGVLSKGHAKVLMGIDDSDTISMLAERVIAETLSVRGLEEAVLLLDLNERRTPRRGRSTRRRVTYPEVAEAFEEKLDTKVKVEGSTKRGRVVIEFGSSDDLHRICEILEVHVKN